MDTGIFLFINQFVGLNYVFDQFVSHLMLEHFKSVPFMLILWGLWFSNADDQTAIRQKLTTLLCALVPIILVTKTLAETLPFRFRPLHQPGFEFTLPEWRDRAQLEGWSSMPSDHAAIFFALALGFFLINRKAGIISFLLAIFVVCLPRIYFGLHWPSDIVVGAIVGVIGMLMFFTPVLKLVQLSKIVPYFEERPAIGYPILFFATFEVSRMFSLVRRVVDVL